MQLTADCTLDDICEALHHLTADGMWRRYAANVDLLLDAMAERGYAEAQS